MIGTRKISKLIVILAGLVGLLLLVGACGDDATKTPTVPPKEVIKFHDGQWETVWLHNAIAMYITDKGYGYPVEELQGTTGTMLVALPEGDLDVNMEIWRQNIIDWYNENITAGKIVDLTGTTNENVPNGSKGQILETSAQGFYVPTYMIEGDADRGIAAMAPDLKSISDLPKYKDLFKDPEDPSKGIMVNCIIGWACQKIVRAKWSAYGLYDDYNVMEPGAAGAIDANIKGAYDAGEPVLSYYWEPTQLIDALDMTRLVEPVWNQECQTALDAAVADEPFESTIGCAFPESDVHTGVHSSLVGRAPEVVEFLSNVFVGSLPLGDLTTWRQDNNKEPSDAGIYWLKNNEATWVQWVTADAATKVKAALALEAS